MVLLKVQFGARVRILRTGLGLSQEDLAERAELHWTYISGIERGKRNPGLTTISRLARALGVEPGALFKSDSPVKRATMRKVAKGRSGG